MTFNDFHGFSMDLYGDVTSSLLLQGKRSSKALRVETKAIELEEECRGPESYNPRYCALDADTENLVQMVETPKMLRRLGAL